MNDIWLQMMIWDSIIFKPWLKGKVKNDWSVNRNGILQSKGMIDLRLIDWNNIILILTKVIMSFLFPLVGSPSGTFFGRVNVIGLRTCYETLLCKPYMWITLWERSLEPSDYVKGSSFS